MCNNRCTFSCPQSTCMVLNRRCSVGSEITSIHRRVTLNIARSLVLNYEKGRVWRFVCVCVLNLLHYLCECVQVCLHMRARVYVLGWREMNSFVKPWKYLACSVSHATQLSGHTAVSRQEHGLYAVTTRRFEKSPKKRRLAPWPRGNRASEANTILALVSQLHVLSFTPHGMSIGAGDVQHNDMRITLTTLSEEVPRIIASDYYRHFLPQKRLPRVQMSKAFSMLPTKRQQ